MSWKKISDFLLEELVKESISVSEVIRKLGYTRVDGGTHAHITKRIRGSGISTSHFLGQASRRGIPSNRKKSVKDILIKRMDGNKEKRYQLHKALQEIGVAYTCSECNQSPNWNKKPLVLQIDHIDGNPLNNVRENLRYLCPNCHSQTDTFGTRNIKSWPSGGTDTHTA